MLISFLFLVSMLNVIRLHRFTSKRSCLATCQTHQILEGVEHECRSVRQVQRDQVCDKFPGRIAPLASYFSSGAYPSYHFEQPQHYTGELRWGSGGHKFRTATGKPVKPYGFKRKKKGKTLTSVSCFGMFRYFPDFLISKNRETPKLAQ